MRKPRRLFTVEEDEYICAHYGDSTLCAMGVHLGRHWTVVQQRVDRLVEQGRLDRSARYYGRPWTDDEIDWLADNWGLHSDEYCARHLRRSVVACTIAAKRKAQVSWRMAFWTARQVGDLFGVDSHMVVKWIEAGCLRGRRSHVRAGNGYVCWEIDERTIKAFVRSYPWHYEPGRIERGTVFRQQAERVWATDPWLTVAQVAHELGVDEETVRRHIRRGWLRGERTWEAGQYGGYRVPRSALATFRRRQGPRVVSPALAAWYRRGERRASTAELEKGGGGEPI